MSSKLLIISNINLNVYNVFFIQIHFLPQDLLTQLRAIFDIIVEFQAKQSRMYNECLQEVELRQQYNSASDTRTEQVWTKRKQS